MDYTEGLPRTFLGIENAPLDAADVMVLPVPFEGAVCFAPGTARGPNAIIRASSMLDFWDEELLWEAGKTIRLHTLPPLSPEGNEGLEGYHRRLQEHVAALQDYSGFLLTLGGDHSITGPVVRGLVGDCSDLTIVQLDAHCDLLDEFQDTRLSHSCVMRRLWEGGANLIQIGIRTMDREEYRLAASSERIEIYYAHMLQSEQEMERLLARLRGLSGDVYLSLDVDGLDTGIMPGTGTPQPGGLGWYAVLRCLRALLLESAARIRGADVVEVIPLPGVPLTEFNAAKLAFKVLSYTFYKRYKLGLNPKNGERPGEGGALP